MSVSLARSSLRSGARCEGVKEDEWKNAGKRISVQNSLNAVNSLERVETRKQRPDSVPSQLLIVTEKSGEGGCRRNRQTH